MDGGTIVANRGWYALCNSEKANGQLYKLCKDNDVQITGGGCRNIDGLLEDPTNEVSNRGVAWGRQPGLQWKSSFVNMVIENMGLVELAEMHGEGIHILEDPEWDANAFLTRLKEELER